MTLFSNYHSGTYSGTYLDLTVIWMQGNDGMGTIKQGSGNNLSGTNFMAILCSCHMLNFWFYANFDQFDVAKKSINVPCII